ncbi:beta-lactamase family protein [Streptomyces sp. TRM66268-LWL]|uniref:Beta-lactamase family protein n=1 Tax=Streptomyces polyasparticus TaxID=2767826 RepID=A0ABR7SJJ7_9ACTN|nr:serine hydrolase domain-containing protein [Streptomyces polyasparticus]MBC9715172.1 beta-lactamase family protein [Streptomyces polyasparticus]
MQIQRLRHAATATLMLLLTLLLCAPPTSAADRSDEAPPDRLAKIDSYIRDRMEATGTPGLAYAVVDANGPVHQRAWGKDGRGAPVTADTPFLWGSVAKPITASAVMTLVQDGRLGLDDRVVDHLPTFRFGGREHASQVTVRHLLNQTAGLPESATFKVADCLDPDCPRPGERVDALADVRPLGPPGVKYAYTSANYLLLAAVVESVTGRPYAEHLRESVLEPAGMKGAIADRATALDRQLAPGHQYLWSRPAAIADGMDDSGAAYGYTGGDLNDLAAFAALQLRSGKTADGRTLLTPESVRLMRESASLQPGGEETGYGFGWRVGGLKAPLDKAIWHTGATPGYAGMLFLLPGQGLALVLEQNLHGLLQDEAVMQVGFGAARILAGGEAPGDDPSTLLYDVTVWGVTALALLLLAAAVRSALLVRRPAAPVSLPRLIAGTSAWVLVGALPVTLLAMIMKFMGASQALAWVPDAFTALCVASGAGVLVIALRIALAVRHFRSVREQRAPGDRPTSPVPEPSGAPA